jgi:hypothetical protein
MKSLEKGAHMSLKCYKNGNKNQAFWSSAPKTGKRDPTAPARADRGSGCPGSAPNAEEKRVLRPGYPRPRRVFHFCLQKVTNQVSRRDRFFLRRQKTNNTKSRSKPRISLHTNKNGKVSPNGSEKRQK